MQSTSIVDYSYQNLNSSCKRKYIKQCIKVKPKPNKLFIIHFLLTYKDSFIFQFYEIYINSLFSIHILLLEIL